MAGGNVEMMVSVVPGTMTGFASLNAGLASINNAFLNMTQAISDNFGLVDTALITTGVVAAQVGMDAAKAFGDFEQSMKIVQLVSGQTADEISMLGQRANEFAVQYRVDIDQITEGLQTLGRAGLNSATEQTEVLQNGLSTAKLEGRQLNDVLQELIQNTALLGGNLKSNDFGEQSQYVNDLLVATSMTAPITTHDVSETLKYSGGIAAAAGANIESDEGKRLLEDYMATIAAFAQKGVTGSIAGTALRAFLNKPATQDKTVLEGLATIHLKPEYLWEDDQETMKPISEQIALIQSQMDKLNVPKMDRLQIWSKIVGGKMGQQMMKLESDDIKGLVKDIQDAESAESLANKSMQTFNMNVNELAQKGAVAFRDFGSKVVFVLNPILQMLNKITDFFSASHAMSGFFLLFVGFLNTVLQKIRTVFGAFREGVSNIWRDYASGERLSIRQYRGEGGVGGGGGYGLGGSAISLKQSETPENFLKAWRNQALVQPWKDYENKRLSRDEFGAIASTQKWRQPGKLIAEEFDKNILQRDIIKRMAYDGNLTKQQLTDTQSLTAKQYWGVHGEDIEKAYAKHYLATQKDTAATEQNTQASEASTKAQQNANSQKVQQETKTGEQIVTNTRNTTSQVMTEWNNMCSSMATSLQRTAAQADLAKKYNKGSSNIFEQILYGTPPKTTDPLAKVDQAVARYGSQIGIFQTPKPNLELLKDREAMNKITTQVLEEERDALNKRSILAKNAKNRVQSPELSSITPITAQMLATQKKEEVTLAQQKAAQEKAAIQEQLAIEKEIELLAIERRAIEQEILTIEKQKLATGSKGLGASAYDKRGGNAGAELQRRIDANRGVDTGKDIYKNTGVTAKEVESAVNKYGQRYGYDFSKGVRVDPSAQKVATDAFLKEHKSVIDNAQSRPLGNNVMPLVSDSKQFKQEMKNAGSGVTASIKDGLMRSREGKWLNFLKGDPKNFTGFNKNLRTSANALLNFSDFLGGPVMIAMMVIPIIIQQIQNWYQSYVKELQQAKTRLEEAYTALGTAEDNLKNSFKDIYPDLDEAGLEELMADTFANMHDEMTNAIENGFDEWKKKSSGTTEQLPEYEYDEEKDDGSLKEKEDERTDEEKNNDALNENTKAVYAAVAEINAAMDVYVTKSNDGMWGIDGRASEISDQPTGFAELFPGAPGWIAGLYNNMPGVNNYDKTNWMENGNAFLMTNSQKDDNYAGYTELPGLLLENWKDANGDWIKGLRVAMGNSVDDFERVIPEATKDFLSETSHAASRMGASNNLRLQQSMKQDKKTWQALAKEIAKEERKTGKTLGKDKTNNKRLEGLLSKIQATTGGGFSRTQILQAAYLQQMQDMLAVAQQVMVPIIGHHAEIAAQNLSTNQYTAGGQADTSSSTYATYSVATVIAAMVSQIAMAKAAEATYNQALADGPTEGNKELYDLAQSSKDANDFYKKASQKSYGYDTPFHAIAAGEFFTPGAGYDNALFKTGRFGQDTRFMDRILENYLATAKMTVYGYDPKVAAEYAKEEVKKGREAGLTTRDLYNTYQKNYMAPEFIGQIQAAYEASNIGEPESGSGGSGGSGGGGKDSDDKEKGNKKERVDLVLCNKKEIPKLNVNLFKKPPSFTVLNKNFKLRDIKVNTQDKPKAVLSSIKNAIIDVQKRSDPKIIQDEGGEYDPAGATDGRSVPSGSTNTSTD